jgi:hypothetical protein
MANYNGKSKFVLPRGLQLKNGVNVETITDIKVLNEFDSQIQVLTNNSGSALDLKLTAPKDGAFYFISSAGSNEIHVRDAGTTVTYTILASTQGCFISSDGSDWYVVIKA